MTWDHPHEHVIKTAIAMWICLECGTMYDSTASDEDGDPREWLIPIVAALNRELAELRAGLVAIDEAVKNLETAEKDQLLKKVIDLLMIAAPGTPPKGSIDPAASRS